MVDYPLPPPKPTAFLVETVSTGQAPGRGPVKPVEDAATPPRDQVQLAAQGTTRPPDPQVSKAIKKFNKLLQAHQPLPDKLAKLTALLSGAAEPFDRKGDDRALSQLRNAAGEVVQKFFRSEIDSLKATKSLSVSQKEQRLQQLQKQVEEISWLARGFKASINMDLAFALADIKIGNH